MPGPESSARSWRAGWTWCEPCGPNVRLRSMVMVAGCSSIKPMRCCRWRCPMRGTDRNAGIWRPSLEQIESTVSSQLGPGRVTGNEQGPCFSRQISMYLAKHVGGWSMVKIGRFYHGRHHTTVLHAIRKVEHLRAADDSVDALIEILIATLRSEPRQHRAPSSDWQALLVETVTHRVLQRLAQLQLNDSAVAGQATACGVAT